MGRAPQARSVAAPMTTRTAAALCILGTWLGASADIANADRTFRLTASLHPGAVQYGDPVVADVEVDYDPSTVEPSSIRVQPRFTPYVAGAAPVVQHLHGGAVRFRYSLLCVTDGCLPGNGPRLLQLRPVTATGLAGTRTVTATARWPALRISSRLAPADRTGRVRFHHPATPPAVHYRLAPGALAGGLIALAALSALAAVALAGRELARRSRTARRRGEPTPRCRAAELAAGALRRRGRARSLGEHLVRHVQPDRRDAAEARRHRQPLRPRRLLERRVRGAPSGDKGFGAH